MDGKIGNVHKGMAYLARSTKTRVLPLAIVGSNKPRGPITVKIGKPIDLNENPDEITRAWLKSISELTGMEAKDLESNDNIEEDLSFQNA